MTARIAILVTAFAMSLSGPGTLTAQPRVWIADQGNNQVGGANPNNRILEIDPVNLKTPPDPDGTNVIILNTLPSPAAAFLDELTFDDQERLWAVVKEDSDQDPDGAKRIDRDTGAIQVSISPVFPGEGPGALVYLEGLAWDGSGLWLTGVRQTGGNVLTRVSPVTGARIAPFDAGPGQVVIPGNVAQGLLYDPSGTGFLWHSDVQQQRIYKLDIAGAFAVVKTFIVPFPPKGMDFMGDRIWVAAPFNGIWEIDPAAADGSNGGAVRKFNTPAWNLDGIAILADPRPCIAVDPAELHPVAFIGSTPPDDMFTVRNCGTGVINYTLTPGTSWLTVTPETGDSAGESDTITVSYPGAAGLLAGTYTTAITLAAPEAVNSPVTLAVQLTIETVGPDLDGDGDVDLDDFARLQSCLRGNGVLLTDPLCFPADLDNDNDADAADLTRFLACLSGSSLPVDPACEP